MTQERLECPQCKWQYVPLLAPLRPGLLYSGTCHQCDTTFTFPSERSEVTITINGVSYNVSNEKATCSLASFLHDVAGLPSSKSMCYEGGCGVCMVSATFYDHAVKRNKTVAINSCLQPVYACDGWEVETSEGIGNSKTGFHPIQDRLASMNGSQCGYCSPGMVMSVYSKLKEKPNSSKEDLEGVLDGNICRCTGYRPILDAMKSFSTHENGPCSDIEDLKAKGGFCKQACGTCMTKCTEAEVTTDPIPVALLDAKWMQPKSLESLFSMLERMPNKRYQLVFGNTASGYRRDGPCDFSIDIKCIPELATHECNKEGLKIGANISLSILINLFEEAKVIQGFSYLEGIIKHLEKIGGTAIRNAGSWAGNMMMRWKHHDFISDVFIILVTCKATLQIGDATGKVTEYSPEEFLCANMKQKVILSMTLSPMSKKHAVNTFKVMPRSQNALGYVSAGFNMQLDDDFKVLSKPSIIYGGIRDEFLHASETEGYLTGKVICDEAAFQGALKVLEGEIVPKADPGLTSPDFRKNLALALFYKFVLASCGEKVCESLRSGGRGIIRPPSTSKQTFQTDPEKWPIGKPVPNMSAHLQCSGEADYIANLPKLSGQLYAHFVLSEVGNARIESIDASKALEIPGVVRFLSHNDIPGENNFMILLAKEKEEVFCSGKVLYAGQSLGIIVAESNEIAMAACRKVKVTYTDVKPPILTIAEALENKNFDPETKEEFVKGDAEEAIGSSHHVVKGTVNTEAQYHFQLETLICACVPTDDGMTVYPSTQWPEHIQSAVAALLGINQSRIHVEVKRLGGAFGGKESRTTLIASACALACSVTNRPVKIQTTIKEVMKMIGKRSRFSAEYEVGVSEEGKLNGIKINYVCDLGSSLNESSLGLVKDFADNAYRCDNVHLTSLPVKTNTPSSTWCRGPGIVESIFITETIMEHVAKQLAKDPMELKKLNFYKELDVDYSGISLIDCHLDSVVEQLESSASTAERQQEVALYNKNNRWKKRGLGMVPMKYEIFWNFFYRGVLVSVYGSDGSVAVSHGGIEMGQGIHTKVIQVCAAELGIDVSMVTVRPTNTMATANSCTSGGSVTSETVCIGVIAACKELRSRIEPIKASLGGTPTWKAVINKCHAMRVDLQARFWCAPQTPTFMHYQLYSMVCTEVELDVLTGENTVRRADILYDCGTSMNPELDLGQVEGAFVMGLGYHMSEEIRYDPVTGQCLSASTWDYKVPTSKDIPADFRVELLKNAPNPKGVLGSKACGEPPFSTSCSVLFALKHAVEAAREETGIREHFTLSQPANVEKLQLACLNNYRQFIFN